MDARTHSAKTPLSSPLVSKAAPSGLLQPKCACGGGAGLAGECAACATQRLTGNARIGPLQRASVASAQDPESVPPIVYDVVRCPGQPLDAATRTFFEPRFGHDFSQVRVHTDFRAAESARAVNALAYTVGNDLVFAAGKYLPQSHAGQRLLAHELVHTVQQGSPVLSASSELTITGLADPTEREAERIAVEIVEHPNRNRLQEGAGSQDGFHTEVVGHGAPLVARAWNPCGTQAECPLRESGERRLSSSASLQVGTLDAPEAGEIVSHFGIGSASVQGLSRNPTWTRFISVITSEDSLWEILGFSDCEGGVEQNTPLRQQRANAVLRALPLAARAKIDRAVGAPLSDCVGSNDTAWERSLNRSVVFRRTSTTINFPAETIEATPPRFVCGPDMTPQVSAAVAGIGAAFAGWISNQKEDACDALDSASTGGCAWDIVELHNNAWIYRNYRPACATAAATPACGSSLQVGTACYYAGSINYVIFGKMCRLCADYYLSIPLINTGYARFTKSAMRDLIDIYKGSGITGLATPSGNFRESVQWAEAGFDGWPSGGSAPAGDRSNCVPMCPLSYSGPSFRVNWHPRQYYTGVCGR